MPDNQMRGGTGGQVTVWTTRDHATYRLDPYISRQITEIRRRGPLVALMDLVMGTRPTSQMSFTTQQQWDLPVDTTVATAVADTTTTTLVLADSSMVSVNDVILDIDTNEQMRVSVNTLATNTLTVVRGYNSTAANIGAADRILVLAPAGQEAQDKPELLMRGTDSDTSYNQHIFHAVGLSDIQDRAAMRGPSERLRLSRQCIRELDQKRERAALFMQPGEHTHANSMRSWTMSGLRYSCRRYNRCDMSGQLSFDGLAYSTQHIAQLADTQSVLGITSLANINRVNSMPEVRSIVSQPQGFSEITFNVKKLNFPAGFSLTLAWSPEMDRTGFDDEIYVFSPKHLKRSQFSPKETRLDIQTPGAFRKEWCIAVIEGLYVDNPFAFGVIENCGL